MGTPESEYGGLYGTITEIRDGEDKETENETPDLYCSFEVPVMPCEVKKLEEIFSDLYDEPKTIDDIILDLVSWIRLWWSRLMTEGMPPAPEDPYPFGRLGGGRRTGKFFRGLYGLQ